MFLGLILGNLLFLVASLYGFPLSRWLVSGEIELFLNFTLSLPQILITVLALKVRADPLIVSRSGRYVREKLLKISG